jgi:hypothetical protein
LFAGNLVFVVFVHLLVTNRHDIRTRSLSMSGGMRLVDIDESVSAEVRREMELFGVRVGSIAIKDIILPGDIREILNQVVTAEKQAHADFSAHARTTDHSAFALIRRREEAAATRSLCHSLAAQHGETDGGQPSPGAPEGTGDAGEGRRQGGKDHRCRRAEFAAGEDSDDSVVNKRGR